jgi:hypothetical protein
MDGNSATDKGMIAHVDVSTEHTSIRENDMIARGAIVSHVRSGHNKIIFTNRRRAA